MIFTTRSGLLILDIADHFITNYGLIMGGIFECFLVGWLLKARVARRHVNRARVDGMRLNIIWDICVRFLTPLLLVILIIQALVGELSSAYSGYSLGSLLLYGLGWLLLTLAVAVVFSFYPWVPEKLKKKHHVGEDHLLT